ncbi:MAG: efflux RND transporter periplasmic adaptor subunit [Aestuariibaculum sp.]
MKKYAVYIIVLISGLFLGWLLFGNTSEEKPDNSHQETTNKNEIWTCSMHPQIMQPEPGDCPLCGMDLIPTEAGAEGLSANQFKLTKNALALANIQTTKIGNASTVENKVTLSGKIVENEASNTVQASYFSGRIERLNVNSTGETINSGQLLASIYSPELYAAQQELLTASSLKESQPNLYKAVRNKLKLWKLSDKQINQIETSGKVIDNFPVYATVSGTVTEKLAEQGDYIKQGQPLLKIANLNTVWANFDVYENQIEWFKKGQEVSISANAYPDKAFTGKVDFIDPTLNTKTRTVTLRVVLNNKNNTFKPGMFVKGDVETKPTTVQTEIVSIPASAVMWTGKRSVVYVKTNPDAPVFEMREVELGSQLGNNYQVLSGLNTDEEIVTNGTFTVDAAAQLQGKKSMMNTATTGHESHSKSKNTSNSKMIERIHVSSEFQKQLKSVYNRYIEVKDALVNSHVEEARAASENMLISISKVDMKLLKDNDAHLKWMAIESDLKVSAENIKQQSDIKKQRQDFEQLSLQIIKALEIFGINQTVYLQFCPMALHDEGAYWLSNEKQVLNPYFGESMLKCGEVKGEIN